MPYRLSAASICFFLGVMLCLVVLGSRGALANPVPVDEQSLANGAELYDLYCSECHGVNMSDQNYGVNATEALDPLYDFSDLVDSAEARNSSQPEDNNWLDRVETAQGDRASDSELTEREEVINEVVRVIDEVYGNAPQTGSTETGSGEITESVSSNDGSGVFVPLPGVLNLADPSVYIYGTSEEEMFNSIADGTGQTMPGWRIELGSDDDIWDIVNFIRSFWEEGWLY